MKQKRMWGNQMATMILLSLAPVLSVFGQNEDQNAVQSQILEMFPRADADGDGRLSPAEANMVKRQILRRFPDADADGDGEFSDAERQAIIQKVREMRGRSNSSNPDSESSASAGPAPDHADVSYGEHERNVLDIWLADSDGPAPLAVYIHGGGFKGGSKEKVRQTRNGNSDVTELLEAGISVASINYRLLNSAPLPTPHHDSRRALQFLRSKADEWNIDQDRVAVFGGSAGAQISMWLAYSDEMANPDSEDPIERESTRVTCVATSGGQTLTTPEYWRELGTTVLGSEDEMRTVLTGGTSDEQLQASTIAQWKGATTVEEAGAMALEHSAVHLLSADDPPIFMSYGMAPDAEPPSDPARVRGWLIHHVNFGLILKEKADALDVESHLVYRGSEAGYESKIEFLIDKLQGDNSETP